MREIEEFYSYVEMPLLGNVPPRFKASFGGEHRSQGAGWAETTDKPWTGASPSQRRDYIQRQLECIESSLADRRREAQAMLLYLVQGEPEHLRSHESTS